MRPRPPIQHSALPFDPLKGQIATDHDQPTARGNPIAQQREPVRRGERRSKVSGERSSEFDPISLRITTS